MIVLATLVTRRERKKRIAGKGWDFTLNPRVYLATRADYSQGSLAKDTDCQLHVRRLITGEGEAARREHALNGGELSH